MLRVVIAYYITLFFGILAFFLYGFTPLGHEIAGQFYFPMWAILLFSIYFSLWAFKCPRCSSSIIKRSITIGGSEIWGVSLLPGKKCPSCGLDN
jgi:hypothetical protein